MGTTDTHDKNNYPASLLWMRRRARGGLAVVLPQRRPYRRTLETHLDLLKRQNYISLWHDRRISAGTEWKGQIDTHLESAELILLLISPDFLDSDYCYDIELKRALARHDAGTARVIPVILRPVDWHDAPFGKLQALPPDGKPITGWSSRDEAFKHIVAGIRHVVAELRTSKPAAASVPTTRMGEVQFLADLTRAHRLRAGLSQAQLAEKANLSVTTVRDIEFGQNALSSRGYAARAC
jgi:hypothetical protein